jgi:hypothetical protein
MPLTAYPIVPAFDRDAFTAAPGHVRADTMIDDEGYERQRSLKWLKNSTGAAVVIGRPYVVRHAGGGQEAFTVEKVAASPTDTVEEVVVAIEETADETFGWFCSDGFCEALVEGGTDCTAGDYLSVDDDIVTDGAFKEDTTTRTKNSFAMYMDPTDETTGSAATLRLIKLLGEPAEILT